MNRGKLYVPPQKKKFSVFGDKSQGGKNKRDSWKNRNNEDTMIREDNSNSRNASTVRGRNANPNNYAPIPLLVSGLTNINEPKLMQFLKKRVKQQLSYSAFRQTDKGATFSVRNPALAEALIRISDTFNGQRFTITRNTHTYSVEELDTIKQVLISRYNPESNYLNLRELIDDPILKEKKIKSDLKSKPFSHVIWRMIGEGMKNLQTIDFASNRLNNLSNFSSLAEYAPNLENFNFESNNIQSLRDLDNLKNFRKLRELILNKNDICDSESDAILKRNLSQKFKTLQTFNGEPVGIPFDSTGPSAISIPPEVGSFLPENLRQTVHDFFQRYFTAYDSDRSSVINFYHDACKFSYSFLKSNKLANSTINSYTPKSRNLQEQNGSDSKEYDKKLSYLCQGKQELLLTLGILPPTQHQFESFCIDCWESKVAQNPVLLIFFHGNFYDFQNKTPMSFDRTFVLIATDQNISIVNDQLRVRKYTKKFGELEAPAVIPQVSEEEIKKLMTMTKLNRDFATQCYTSAKNNYEEALKLFLEAQRAGTIPQNAYYQ